MEYCIQFWWLHLNKEVVELKKMQKTATELIPGLGHLQTAVFETLQSRMDVPGTGGGGGGRVPHDAGARAYCGRFFFLVHIRTRAFQDTQAAQWCGDASVKNCQVHGAKQPLLRLGT